MRSRDACGVLLLLLSIPALAFADDWPMLGRDPQRTGWTRDEVREPVERKWYRSFHEHGLASGVQPVIADGRVYVGTMHGTMFAIDADTGEDVWTRTVAGGILHSAAVAEGLCFFGATDGDMYALDAETGEIAWTHSTGAALWNAPVVVEGTVYIGGRDGYFYAVDAATGRRRWRTPIPAPILCSPAYDDGRVYFAAENMTAYALEAETGDVAWSSRLHGVSARAYHPVVAGDLVMFTTQPGLGKFGPVDVLLEASRDLGLRPRRRIGADPRGPGESEEQLAAKRRHNEPLLKDPAIYPRQLERVREIQRERPAARTFFAFDKDSGEEPWIAPVCWQESCGGPGDPPIVSPEGDIYLKFALFTWAKYDDYFQYTQIGRLDPETGDITPLRDPMERTQAIGITHDEMARFTGSGDMIIHAREGFPGYRGIVGIDLATEQLQTLGDNIHYGHASIGPMNILRLLKDEPIPPAMEYLTRGSGVFGGAGTYAAVAIADDTIYYIPGHEGRSNSMLIAWRTNPGGEQPEWQDPNDERWQDLSYLEPESLALLREQPFDWDMLLRQQYGRAWPYDENERVEPEPPQEFEARRESARRYARDLSDEALLAYIESPAADASESAAPDDLRRQLETQVRELISRDWQPLRFPDLMFGGWYYFDDPAEPFTVLAAAWPLLPSDLQQEVRDYLRQRFAERNPLTVEQIATQRGERRTRYALPGFVDLRHRDLRPPGLGRLHAVWAWAHATGDWQTLEPYWTSVMRPMVHRDWELPDSVEESLWANQSISGLIAYVRIARRFDDPGAEQLALEKLLPLMRRRVEAERTYIHTHFTRQQGHPRNPAYPGRYLHLTPAVGRLVRDHALPQNEAIYERYVQHHRPSWHLAWGPMTYYAWENSIDQPINAWATFSARAMLFADAGPALREKLDIPWSAADLYHIHKLAMTCRADWPE